RDVGGKKAAERAVASPAVENARDRKPVRRRKVLDHFAHPSVTHQDQLHRDSPIGSTAAGSGKNWSCRRWSVAGRSASRITNVTFRRAAACDSIRIGTPPVA